MRETHRFTIILPRIFFRQASLTIYKSTDAEGKVSDIDMPATSNVLQYFTEDGTKISVRPSGTEPKIKFYMEVRGNMKCEGCYERCCQEADEKIKAIRASLGI